MATEKKPAKSKKTSTVREQAKSKSQVAPKKHKIKAAAKHVSRPFKAAKKVGAKEYYLPLPDNKAGTFLNKKRRFTPKFFVEAWYELKLVSWPNRKETTKLTIAVLIFAVTFGLGIAAVDFVLDKVFKELLLK